MIDPMGAHAHPSASTFSYASPLRAPKRYDRNGNLVAAPASPATPVAPAATDSWARPSAAPAAAATGPTVSCEEDARRVARMLITEAQGGGVGHDMTKVRTPEEARECARALLEVYLRGRDTRQAGTSPPPPVPAAAAAAAARQQPQSAASSSDASLGPTATPSPVSPVPRAADASSSFDTHAVASAVDAAAAAAAAAPATPALPTAAAAAAAVGTEPQPQQPSTPLVPANPAAPAAAATTTTTRVKKAPPPLMTPPSPAVHATPPAGLVLSPTNDTHAHNNYNYNNAATTTIATTAAATEAGKLLDQYLAGNTKKAEKRHPRPQPPQQQQQAAPAAGGPVSPVSPTTPAFTAVKREAQQARSVAATYAHAPPQPQAESADALEEMLVHNLSIAVAESIFIGGTRASLNLRKAVEEESISSSSSGGSGTDDSDDEAAVAAAIIDDDVDADEDDDDDDIDNLCAEEEAREASEQAQELAVRLHNRYRAEAHAGRTVQADEGLVRNAAAHAQACAAQGCLSYALSATEGQNIFQLSGSFTERLTDEDLVRQALSHWAAEAEKFKEGGGGVAGLRSAPHYTQLVWAESSRIGVGVARSTNKAFVVCNYTPRGNKLKPESIAANVPVPPPLPLPAVAASEDCQEA